MNKKRMQYLIETLNHAADVYYNTGEEVMPNFEYDALYDELEDLETETGIILPDSPTQRAGIDVNGANLPKVMHEYPALSLAKTKDVSPNLKGSVDPLGSVLLSLIFNILFNRCLRHHPNRCRKVSVRPQSMFFPIVFL